MPFGMKNSPSTFQCLINMIITGLDKCKSRKENQCLGGKKDSTKDTIAWKAYIDDAIIYSEEWDQQIKTFREFFERLR